MNRGYSEDEINEIVKDIPLGRIGKTEEIAKCIKFLIDNEYITGQVITVDGGWLI